MSHDDERPLCAYPRCRTRLNRELVQFCLSHLRVDRAALERGIDDRNPETKERFYAEQQGRCNYCGRGLSVADLVWAHLTPPDQGGSDAVGNLQLTCQPCNEKKHLRTDREFRADNRAELPQSPRTPASPPIRSEALRRVNYSQLRRRGGEAKID